MYIDHFLGARIAPCTADINNDAVIDVTVGNYCGGLSLYYGDMNVSTGNPFGDNSHSIHIYPNPATDEIAVTIDGMQNESVSCSIADIWGRTILATGLSEQNNTISVNALPAGYYFLTLRTSGGYSAVSRFIINR
jgi:hypothetical protein